MFPIVKINGQLKTGHFSKKLLKPPLVLPPYKKDDLPKTKTFIQFSLHGFTYDTDSLPYLYEKQRKNKEKDFHLKKVKHIEFEINDSPFIPNKEIKFDDIDFLKGSGVDFYVDEARFLPNNVGPVKIVLRMIDE